MQSDINYLNSRLAKIEGFGDTGDYLLNVVKSKKVESPPPPPAVPAKDTAEPKREDAPKAEEKSNGEGLEKKEEHDSL